MWSHNLAFFIKCICHMTALEVALRSAHGERGQQMPPGSQRRLRGFPGSWLHPHYLPIESLGPRFLTPFTLSDC